MYEDGARQRCRRQGRGLLSGCGKQKDFGELLYADLGGVGITVFFDKESLVIGRISRASSQEASACKMTVAVLSEEFFAASSWPMAEIITSVEAKEPEIVPLFYLISPEMVDDAQKREEWSAKWESWGIGRHDMGLQQWKETLKKIRRTTGIEKKPFMNEVQYKRKTVVCIHEKLGKESRVA